MSDLPAYASDISPALHTLVERAHVLLRADSVGSPTRRQAAWLLGDVTDPAVTPLRSQLDHWLENAADPDLAERYALLRPEGHDRAASFDEAGVSARLEHPPTESWDTLDFLVLAYLWQRQGEPLPRAAEQRVRRLMGKFEVFGRVFDRYDENLRKRSERYTDLLVYAVLSLVLLELYDRTGNLNLLNTALKLSDLLASTGDLLTTTPPVLAAIAALAGARSRLEEWYASEGFCLPADR